MRSTLQIKVGTYTGTGVAQAITDVGFEPQLVIVKGGANHAVFRTRHMRNDSTSYLATNVANLTGAITFLTNSGFVVGTDVTVNANTTVYYYIAIRGLSAQNYFRIFRYYGTGGDNRDVTAQGLYFQPDFLHIKQDGANLAASKIADQAGDNAFHLNGNAVAANEIQNLQALGFQLGTSARTNASATEYFGFALKHLTGVFKTGSFTGNGATQSITGLGFKPDFVIVSNLIAATSGVIKTTNMTSNTSHVLNNFSSITNGITSLDTDGFSLGAASAANGNGNTIYYIAGKAGNHATPIPTRTLA